MYSIAIGVRERKAKNLTKRKHQKEIIKEQLGTEKVPLAVLNV
jgi:hypothetical protein